MEVHKVLCLPRNLHMEVHKVLQPEPRTEHGGSQSAAPATNSGDVSVCVVTKCRACHEFCTWRFTKCCACHEFCTSRNNEYSNHNGGTDRRPPPTTADNATPTASNGGSQSTAPATNSGDFWVCVVTKCRVPRILHVEVHKVLRLPRILVCVISVCVISVCVVSVCVVSVCGVSVCGLCTCCLGVEGG